MQRHPSSWRYCTVAFEEVDRVRRSTRTDFPLRPPDVYTRQSPAAPRTWTPGSRPRRLSFTGSPHDARHRCRCDRSRDRRRFAASSRISLDRTLPIEFRHRRRPPHPTLAGSASRTRAGDTVACNTERTRPHRSISNALENGPQTSSFESGRRPHARPLIRTRTRTADRVRASSG